MTQLFLSSRRGFCANAALALLGVPQILRGQVVSPAKPHVSSTHPDVGSIDRDRILAAASSLLKSSPLPLTALRSNRSPGTPNDFYSEPENVSPDVASPSAPWKERAARGAGSAAGSTVAFIGHRDALFNVSVAVATLTAAYVLTSDPAYANRAADHLRAWFLIPDSKMSPNLQLAWRTPNAPIGHFNGNFAGVVEGVPLVDIAQAIPFLASSSALTSSDYAGLLSWFAAYLQWLTESPLATLARDQKDHHGSSWLLQAAACAHLNAAGLSSDDSQLATLRHHFRTVTLRAQIHPTGRFPQEVSTNAPYRNSLFNLDLLSGACDLLSTRFESAWEYELQDGPGMRAAIAYHAPFIANRSTWPFPADAAYFDDLPGRRSGLLLAGRAFSYAQYTEIWRSLTPTAASAPSEILRSEPLREPLLWVNHPKPAPVV